MSNFPPVVFPPVKLPSGAEITFRSVNFMERRRLMKQYQRDSGYLFEELLAAFALETYRGEPIKDIAPGQGAEDIINRFNVWNIMDVTFYSSLFVTVVVQDEDMAETIKKTALSLTDGTLSPSPTPQRPVESRLPAGLNVIQN